jgi:U3 small nucleolar ribonucleoprotein protein LCP5
MSKKDAKRRRAEEEEVAFGGLGAGKGGKRRLGGFGAEFDDLLGGDRGGDRKRTEAYDQMRGMKKQKTERKERDYDGVGSSGLTGGGAGSGKRTKNKFDKAVSRSRG